MADLALGPWSPVDLSGILSGAFSPQKPTLARREDGACLLYAGKTHTIFGEAASGKSWIALHITAQELRNEKKVVYIDYEDDPLSIVMRLRSLGVAVEMMDRGLLYIRPEESIQQYQEAVLARITEFDPSLVVIDGVTEAMTVEGTSLLDNQDVASFFGRLPNPIARQGPAVLMVDHVVKKAQEQGRYAIGGVHKLNAISGAAYKVERVDPFGIGQTGASDIILAKDRLGQVQKRTLNGKGLVGVFSMTSGEDGAVDAEISCNTRRRPRLSAEDVVEQEILEVMGAQEFSTKGAVLERIPRASGTKNTALNSLIDKGMVTSQKPYRRLT